MRRSGDFHDQCSERLRWHIMNTSFKKDLIKDRGGLLVHTSRARVEYMYPKPKPLIRGLGIHPWLDSFDRYHNNQSRRSQRARVSSVGD